MIFQRDKINNYFYIDFMLFYFYVEFAFIIIIYNYL